MPDSIVDKVDKDFLDAITLMASAEKDAYVQVPRPSLQRLIRMASERRSHANALESFRETLVGGKYTRWIDEADAQIWDAIHGVIWLVGELRARVSSRDLNEAGLRVDRQVGGKRRAMAALHALVHRRAPDLVIGEAMKLIRDSLRSQSTNIRERLIDIQNDLQSHGGRELAAAAITDLINNLEDDDG